MVKFHSKVHLKYISCTVTCMCRVSKPFDECMYIKNILNPFIKLKCHLEVASPPMGVIDIELTV